MNFVSKAAVLGAAFFAVVPAASMAGTATGTINVTANVTSNCTLSANPLAFGSYDPLVTNASTALTGATTVSVTCTQGSNPIFSIAAGNGNSASVNGAAQQSNMLLSGGNALLGYTFAIGTPASLTTGINSPIVYPVNGVVAAAQDVPNGNYADSLVATVSF